MFSNEQYSEHARAVWDAIGGYPLTDWKVGHNFLSYVQANGVPPRGKHSRVHVFLFLRKWQKGKQVEWLCSIIRREWFKSGIT